ncbi:hypothetical protein GGD67_002817 [Bradyrhizobium sp. IAR9]|nr:hypothetical protein [Bradyrhizobium sp. IAR9]NYG45359.1 hypothetical protein [Bradyrhizobium sp. IAR9]
MDFRVLKGIESDILANGSLDHPDEVDRFDFVVASIRGRFKLDRKALQQSGEIKSLRLPTPDMGTSVSTTHAATLPQGCRAFRAHGRFAPSQRLLPIKRASYR